MESIKYFVTVIDEKNISVAAQKLFLSRQALSKSLKKMEKELGTDLICVKHSGIEPTPAGKLFYQNSRKILKIWQSTQNKIYQLNQENTTLHIGFGEISHHIWSIDQHAAFMEKNPNIKIEIESCLPDILINRLQSKDLDAIITNAYPLTKNMEIHTLLERPMYAMVETKNVLASKEFLTPKDLNNKVNIFIPDDQSDWNYFNRIMNILGYSCKEKICQDSSIPTIFSMVKKYHGVFITSAIFKTQLSSPDFTFVPFKTEMPRNAYNLDIRFIYLKDNKNLNALRIYEDYLKNTIQKEFLPF